MGKKYTRNFYSYSKLDINKGELFASGVTNRQMSGVHSRK